MIPFYTERTIQKGLYREEVKNMGIKATVVITKPPEALEFELPTSGFVVSQGKVFCAFCATDAQAKLVATLFKGSVEQVTLSNG